MNDGAHRSGPANSLVALDWGTSSLRAWLVSAQGEVLDRRREDWGIMQLPAGGFAEAFATVTRGWLDPARPQPAIACGMVGSRQGWREAPYLPTPAGLSQLAGNLLPLDAGAGQVLHLVPGVLLADPAAPDVMRGEETQAMGAVGLLGADALLVMPGTHCKWTRLREGQIESFRTLMTGELFALLRRHSILGRGDAAEAPEAARAEAFRRGVQAAQEQGALARLFSTRALMLTGGLPPGCASDFLSGLLIGEELRVNAQAIAAAARIGLTGDAALCDRYAGAFAALDLAPPQRIPDTALAGLIKIASEAGLHAGASLTSVPVGAA